MEDYRGTLTPERSTRSIMSDTTLAPRMRVSVRARPWTEAELRQFGQQFEGVQARARGAQRAPPHAAFGRHPGGAPAAAVARRRRRRAAAARQCARIAKLGHSSAPPPRTPRAFSPAAAAHRRPKHRGSRRRAGGRAPPASCLACRLPAPPRR